MAGAKTVTRRLTSENPRSPWFIGGCSLKPGRTYAVCPGRAKHAIGRARVRSVSLEPLGLIDRREHEAQREGFASLTEFRVAWAAINGVYDADALVWRVEFEAVR